VDNTLSLFARLEDNARRWLDAFQNSSKTSSNAHFFSRHGAQTTNAQQYTRATTGVTPDGFAGNPVNSARFLTHREQLNALHSALEINQRTGKKVFTFDAGYTVGEGYM
jgi:hypothetical protein